MIKINKSTISFAEGEDIIFPPGEWLEVTTLGESTRTFVRTYEEYMRDIIIKFYEVVLVDTSKENHWGDDIQ